MAKKKEAVVAQVLPAGYVPALKKVYKEEIVEKLTKQFSYTTVMQVPRLVKITINEGVGDGTQDRKVVEEAAEELALITGQKAVLTSSKKDVSNFKLRRGMPLGTQDRKVVEEAAAEPSLIAGQKALITVSRKDISNFKLRKGMPIGVKVTLRGVKMYEFLERLVAISLPRIRDFKGISENFDGRGNYTLGVKEQIIFPEIDIDKITKVMGMEITFTTSAGTDKEAYALLREFGLPFKNIKHNN